jgi:hypothetical protein
MKELAMNAHDIDSKLEARARRRVGMKIGFYTHALVFVLVNAALYALNSVIGGNRWSVWPLWGWGLGLTIHGVVTFVALNGDGLRERMLQSEMARLRKRQ